MEKNRIRDPGWEKVGQYNKRNSKESAGYKVGIMGVRTRIQAKVIMTKIVKLKKILTKNAIYDIYFILNSKNYSQLNFPLFWRPFWPAKLRVRSLSEILDQT
jgi:hypothetical protein